MSDIEDPDRAYYYRRAEQELNQAQCARDQSAVRAHYELAGYYLDRVYGPGTAELPARGR